MLLPEREERLVSSRCRSSVRGFALVAAVALVAAGSAEAKFTVSVGFAPEKPHVGEPVRVVIHAAGAQGTNCPMRLVAVAPGINRYHALDALINGGYGVV